MRRLRPMAATSSTAAPKARLGDTFVINGNASAETYRIYTRAAFAGGCRQHLRHQLPQRPRSSSPATAPTLRRSLPNSPRSRKSASTAPIRPGQPERAGGDTFKIIGDFSATSLRLNTITIDGDAGDDTIDISSLASAHRIVFRSNGGNDTIIGTLRPEDVIELPDGATLADYTSTTVDGVTTLTNGDHSITYTAAGAGPQIGDDAGEDDDSDGDTDGDVDPPPPPPPPADSASTPKVGTARCGRSHRHRRQGRHGCFRG